MGERWVQALGSEKPEGTMRARPRGLHPHQHHAGTWEPHGHRVHTSGSQMLTFAAKLPACHTTEPDAQGVSQVFRCVHKEPGAWRPVCCWARGGNGASSRARGAAPTPRSPIRCSCWAAGPLRWSPELIVQDRGDGKRGWSELLESREVTEWRTRPCCWPACTWGLFTCTNSLLLSYHCLVHTWYQHTLKSCFAFFFFARSIHQEKS